MKAQNKKVTRKLLGRFLVPHGYLMIADPGVIDEILYNYGSTEFVDHCVRTCLEGDNVLLDCKGLAVDLASRSRLASAYAIYNPGALVPVAIELRFDESYSVDQFDDMISVERGGSK